MTPEKRKVLGELVESTGKVPAMVARQMELVSTTITYLRTNPKVRFSKTDRRGRVRYLDDGDIMDAAYYLEPAGEGKVRRIPAPYLLLSADERKRQRETHHAQIAELWETIDKTIKSVSEQMKLMHIVQERMLELIDKEGVSEINKED